MALTKGLNSETGVLNPTRKLTVVTEQPQGPVTTTLELPSDATLTVETIARDADGTPHDGSLYIVNVDTVTSLGFDGEEG